MATIIAAVLGWFACGVGAAALFGACKLDDSDRQGSYAVSTFMAPVALLFALAMTASRIAGRRAEVAAARHAAELAKAKAEELEAEKVMRQVERELAREGVRR
jgi:hypothetical protein